MTQSLFPAKQGSRLCHLTALTTQTMVRKKEQSDGVVALSQGCACTVEGEVNEKDEIGEKMLTIFALRYHYICLADLVLASTWSDFIRRSWVLLGHGTQLIGIKSHVQQH